MSTPADTGSGQPERIGAPEQPNPSAPVTSGPTSSAPATSGAATSAPDTDSGSATSRPAGGSGGPDIRIRGLVKRYGEAVAVSDVDLDIQAGEVFALLGPNGAGKTTMVEILEGYRKRDSGEVSVLGVDPGRRDRAWLSRIGIVPQSSNENAELSITELVQHFAKYYPDPRDPDEVIVAVGLEEKRDARSRSLSGGQRRRLDVALGSSVGPGCSSWTSPPPASTRRPGTPSGSSSAGSAPTARPSC